jgi:hypothetical protein
VLRNQDDTAQTLMYPDPAICSSSHGQGERGVIRIYELKKSALVSLRVLFASLYDFTTYPVPVPLRITATDVLPDQRLWIPIRTFWANMPSTAPPFIRSQTPTHFRPPHNPTRRPRGATGPDCRPFSITNNGGSDEIHNPTLSPTTYPAVHLSSRSR